uniref:Cilia-and flagella-associated protein n=1 Tax=Schistosoma japonicum TaxID=6182 RepID=C1LDU9_SCHJA|nr:hypothetical protein [Schistosoma japonicum]
MSPLRTYNSGVLLGNWWEERILENEEKISRFSKNGDRESSTHFLSLLTESIPSMIDVSAAATDGYLRFGSNVQILNPGTSPYYIKSGLAAPRAPHVLGLSIDISCDLTLELSNSRDNIFMSLERNGLLTVTASKNMQPSAKNIFRICCLRENQYGRIIRYGEPIVLALQPDIISSKCSPSLQKQLDSNQFLYLASDLQHLGDQNLQPGSQSLYFEVGKPSFLSQWRLEYDDPHLRREFEGRPVKSDQKLLIKHVRSNKALALEPDFVCCTLFGKETCLTVRTYYDSHKLERDVNVWIIATAKQQGLCGITNEQTPHKILENTSLESDCAAGSNLTDEKQVHFEENTLPCNE